MFRSAAQLPHQAALLHCRAAHVMPAPPPSAPP
jgi:hypothetical protein